MTGSWSSEPSRPMLPRLVPRDLSRPEDREEEEAVGEEKGAEEAEEEEGRRREEEVNEAKGERMELYSHSTAHNHHSMGSATEGGGVTGGCSGDVESALTTKGEGCAG